jgi:tRNA nucleotidyltransferase (CCA-adding enzyme)
MEKQALEILKIFTENNYSAYIVGGYVRDKILGKKSNDIDICTSATPKEIKQLFETSSQEQYGSIPVIYKNNIFDITTFRKEIKYEKNRKPIKIKYIKKIKKDLLRRDFTINTLCINEEGNIEDILNVRQDLDNHLIKTVGNPRYKIKEDCLRILRAIRFATILDFEIEEKTKYYLSKYGYLLKKLSYQRKKEELNKIFSNSKKEKGRQLILELKLENHLNLPNLKDITLCDNIIGIWSQLNVDYIYPFNKLEREQMKSIRELLDLDLYDPYTIYKYGLYLTTVAAQIKKDNIVKINKIYQKLPISSKKDIVISPIEISKILKKSPGNYLKAIIEDIEKQIIYGKIENTKPSIKKYILANYKKD